MTNVKTSFLDDANIFSFEEFNAFQSRVLTFIYEHKEKNCLIRVPEALDRMIISEIIILRYIKESENNAIIIIYICSSLRRSQELRDIWTEKFKNIIDVEDCNLDVNVFKVSNLKRSLLICSTFEKIEMFTRMLKRRTNLMTIIPVIIIDEIYYIVDKKGFYIELLLTRILYLNNVIAPNSMRIYCFTNTQCDLRCFSDWLNSEIIEYDGKHSSYEGLVLGFKSEKNDWFFDGALTIKIPSILREYIGDEKVVIFCSTRKNCEKTALKIKESNIIKNSFDGDFSKISDSFLIEILRSGIGILTPGLQESDHRFVKYNFESGNLKVLCCLYSASTLIDTPNAIFKGTKYFNTGKLLKYSNEDMLNVISRITRKSNSESGKIIVMTENKDTSEFNKLFSDKEPVESKLIENLLFVMNIEVNSKNVESREETVKWMEKTYFYNRLNINRKYLIKEEMSVEEYINNECEKCINSLINIDFINKDMKSTCLGNISSQYYLSVETTKLLGSSEFPKDVEKLLSILVESREFDEVELRSDDKSKLKFIVIDPDIRYKYVDYTDDNFFTIQNKVHLLIQSSLGTGVVNDWVLSQDFHIIKRIAERVLSAFLVYYSNKKCFTSVECTLQLLKSIKTNMWYDNTNRLIQQIKGIGEKNSKKFFDQGINSFDRIRDLKSHHIEKITKHRVGWGIQIVDIISSIPNYTMKLFYTNDGIKVIVKNISKKNPSENYKGCDIVVGQCNKVVLKEHAILYSDTSIQYDVKIYKSLGKVFTVCIIDRQYVGIDAFYTFNENDITKYEENMAEECSEDETIQEETLYTTSKYNHSLAEGQKRISTTLNSETVVWEMKGSDFENDKPKTEEITENTKEKDLNDDFWDSFEFKD